MRNQNLCGLALVLVWGTTSPAYAQEAPAAAPTPAPPATPAPSDTPTPAAPTPSETPAPAVEATTPPASSEPATAAAAPEEQAAPAVSAAPPAAPTAAGWGDLSATEAQGDTPVFDTKIYGFINASLEKSASTPTRGANGETVFEESPYEWDVLNFNIMAQGSIIGRFKYFFNLVSNGAGSNTEDISVDVRNAWVEMPLIAGFLNLRAGKTYRRFGLYNEILDAVPTFIGIEPPEIFDKDHLMLTRTTNFMLHGAVNGDFLTLNYSATTGNDEKTGDNVPLGGDVNVQLGGWLKLGSSFYWSGKDAAPSRDVGEGSPRGGVLNWMAKDEYTVAGAYAEAQLKALLIQMEFWNGHHDAERDPTRVAAMATADLNDRQRSRLFVNGDPDQGANINAVYNVQTFYTRLGYELLFGDTFTLTPYAQFDWFANPETVKEKDYGGDEEAGLADDGSFLKYTLGTVIRPVPQLALKIDGSVHQQKFNGVTEIYPEVRSSLSYLWEL